jgi:hypothetical protein
MCGDFFRAYKNDSTFFLSHIHWFYLFIVSFFILDAGKFYFFVWLNIKV